MARLPHAAKVLVGQVRIAEPRSTSESYGEPDGLGVHRQVRFSPSAGEYLDPLLDEIDDDRIIDHRWVNDDDFVVTFTNGIAADETAPFPLHAAAGVVEARTRVGVAEADEDPDRTTDLDGESISTGNSEE